MKQAYPIILTPSENGYVVYVPDLDINTEEGSRRRHRHGRRRYRPLGISAQDLGREIPAPSAALPTLYAASDGVHALVDFDAYRRANDMRTVRQERHASKLAQ